MDPILRKTMETGLICQGAVSEDMIPVSAVTESINWDFDVIGSAQIRKGLTRLGDSAFSGDVLGLYEFRDSGAGTNNQIIAVNSTSVSYLSSGAWTAKRTGLTSGSKARFTTFLDYVFMVNGTESTAIWDGNPSNSFITTGNASSAPTGKYIENFRSRIWIAGNTTYPDRIYYSSIPSAVTTPIITWDTSATTGQWIDVSPSDGENITALKKTRNSLLVFKPNRLYRVFSIAQIDPDPYYAVGTSSQESVVDTKNGVYFHHQSGFYNYSPGGIVQEISRPVIDFVKAITVANYSKVCGSLDKDGDHVNWAIGDVTVNGITYNNMVLRYTISTQVWTHRIYPTQFLVSGEYNDGTTKFSLIGDESGNIYKVNVGNTDDGTAITYSLIHRWETLDGLVSTSKTIENAVFSHEGGMGTNVAFQTDVDGSTSNDWSKGKGQFGESNTGLPVHIKGRKMRLRLYGTSKGETFAYNGFELPDVTREILPFV